MKTLIVGLGNPILGDDGVGWKVAEEVKKQIPPDAPVDVICLSLGGLGLMEHLIGYQRAILIDSFMVGANDELGAILILKLSELPNYSALHTSSTHDTSLQNAIELGRAMGAQLPDEVEVVGIATENIQDFSEELSPPVAQVVPLAVKFVMELLEEKMM